MVDELAGEHIARFFVNGGDMIAPEIRIFVPVVSYASRNLFQQSTFKDRQVRKGYVHS